MFKPVSPFVNFPELEKSILKFWKEDKTFEKSLEKTKNKPHFVFYEGPPTANGKPHLGHVVTRAFKDIFPRFKTMQGFYVKRKGGWDTQGLPVEVEVEKELGISGKDQIENLVPGDKKASIVKFNELCRKNVWKYIDLWENMIERVGNWIDLKDAYVTYEKYYIESVWWSLKKLYDKDLLYLGYKVVPYCTRCESPLSSHEVVQDYRETEDDSVYVKFPVLDEEKTYFLVWTTTPWTLPGNVAIAVDPNIYYSEVKFEGETFIVAEDAVERLGFEKGERIKGGELLGKYYKPIFPFLADKFKENKVLHTIIPADFVKTDEGTGLVHTAVMYGEEDFELGKKLGLPMYHLVDIKGRFTKDAGDYSTLYIRDANPVIIKDLLEDELIYKVEGVLHQYPFCWRCHTPLVYYALDSWFIQTTKVKEELIKNNDSVNWVPSYIKRGRMKNWYETLIDWSLSRNRYWGTPLPVWTCESCKEKIAVGSFEELEQLSKNKDIDWENFDLHRPWVDEIVFECQKCKGVMTREPYIIDVWYDSGSMPFAQYNYPFENKTLIDEKKQFPADFISEAIDQTRGWFFSLQAISTMIFGQTPYKNVVVFDHVLDEKGKKMSKHLGNVIDPWSPLEKYGADATRWFFFSSVPIGTPYRVSLEIIGESLRRFILTFWNTYNFFVSNANIDKWEVKGQNSKGKSESKKLENGSENVLDKWIVARLNSLIKTVTEGLEKFDTYNASRAIENFVIEDFSKWYVRRSRARFGPTAEDENDKNNAYSTYFDVLVTLCKLLAPFTPFVTEEVYKNLTGEDSVHLSDWPSFEEDYVNKDLEEEMRRGVLLASSVNAFRKENNLKVRIPLKKLSYKGPSELSNAIKKIVSDEVNVYDLVYEGKDNEYSVSGSVSEENQDLLSGKAREIIRQIQGERKKLGTNLNEKVDVELEDWPKEFESEIKRKALVRNLTKSDKFSVKKVNE